MKQKSISKSLLIILPLLFLGLFIIGISWTFGNSTPGQVLGTLEGIILILIGPIIVFFQEIKKVCIKCSQQISKFTKKLFEKISKKKK